MHKLLLTDTEHPAWQTVWVDS